MARSRRGKSTREIAATHRDLREAVAAKTFREDLFYRLSMVEIRVPALEERKEDIPSSHSSFFVDKFSTLQFGKEIKGITQRAQIILARHNWPGTIRELENVVGHASMMVLANLIDVGDLPDYLPFSDPAAAGGPHGDGVAAVEGGDSFEEHEKRLVHDALTRAEGNQSKAAPRIAGIGRDALRYKMKNTACSSLLPGTNCEHFPSNLRTLREIGDNDEEAVTRRFRTCDLFRQCPVRPVIPRHMAGRTQGPAGAERRTAHRP